MKRQFLTKKILKIAARPPLKKKNLKKTSNILRSKKAGCLKISQSIIYVKICFYIFFSAVKDIIQAQSKTNH